MSVRPNSLQARDIAHSLHPFTNLVDHRAHGPQVIARGKGIYIYDDTGKEFLDAGAGLWSVSLGYGQKRLVEAAKRQMELLPYYHSFRNMSNEPAIELAEKLIEMLPVTMSKRWIGMVPPGQVSVPVALLVKLRLMGPGEGRALLAR